MPDITYDVGRVSFVMKGAWNLATSYEKLDAVSYNGSLYIAKQDVPGGTAITNTTYWQLAAEKGDKGDTGGVDSVNGQQGDVWFPDSRQLISDGYTTDTEPFLMKGNDSDSDRFELATKLGNTVAVNQLCDYSKLKSGTYSGITVTKSGDELIANGTASANAYILLFNPAKIATISGHKYLVIVPSGTAVTYYDDSSTRQYNNVTSSIIFTGSGVNITPSARISNGTTVTNVVISMSLIDLTLWFGSNDRIPSDLLSHPENWGRYFAGSLDSNAGTLESADGTVLTSTSRNLLDPTKFSNNYTLTWAGGGLYAEDKSVVTDYIPVIPNTEYATNYYAHFFAYDENKNYIGNWLAGSPGSWVKAVGSYLKQIKLSGCSFIRAVYRTSANGNEDMTAKDICLSLYYSGESGYDQYYPFSVLAEVDTGSEVLRSAGAVADEKTPDGTITRRVGIVDLGALNWTKSTSGPGRFYSGNLPAYAFGNVSALCGKYVFAGIATGSNYYPSESSAFKLWGRDAASAPSEMYVHDESSGSLTAAQFKTAMSGVYLNYELSTPTTEQGTAFDPLVVTVKGGMLSWTNTKGIPVGQESHWFENLRKRVEERLPDPPSGDGTYRLACTISGGVKTYSWEA